MFVSIVIIGLNNDKRQLILKSVNIYPYFFVFLRILSYICGDICHSNMKSKTRTLFISLALSFLIGCLARAEHFTPESVETPFGTLAETLFFYDYLLEMEEDSFSEINFSSEIIEGDALIHFFKCKRVNSPSSSKDGLTFTKRNYIIYSSHSIPESNRRFPSGLTEARQYLISLGKLII